MNAKTLVPFLIKAGWFPCLVFALHCVLSRGFDAYVRLWWLDIPMHLLGGFAIAHFFYVCLEYLDRLGVARVGSRQASLIMVFGLVAAATVVWELAEFLADVFFKAGAQRNLADTMKDEFNGLVGGAVYIAGALAGLSPRPAATVVANTSDYSRG